MVCLPVIPSGPKKAPHWAQKKCSGCHVRSRAVTTFCESELWGQSPGVDPLDRSRSRDSQAGLSFPACPRQRSGPCSLCSDYHWEFRYGRM